MTAPTPYHNENGNLNRALLFVAPDEVFFDLVPDKIRVRPWQSGDPVPVFGATDGMAALTVTTRTGALAVYFIDSRAKFGPGVDPAILLQVDPREWSQQFRTNAYCNHCGILKPSQRALCFPDD